MLRAIPAGQFGAIEWIPQAIINRPVSYFESRFGFKFISGSDDLDEYQEATLSLDGLPVALMHYHGYPDDTTTVYLPFGFNNVAGILRVIGAIAKEFALPPDAVSWQRADELSF